MKAFFAVLLPVEAPSRMGTWPKTSCLADSAPRFRTVEFFDSSCRRDFVADEAMADLPSRLSSCFDG